MNNNDKLLAILELTAKKLNPPYKKDVKAIALDGIEKVNFDKLNPYLRYLRGYNGVSAKNIIERQKESIGGWEPTRPICLSSVTSIVKIDDTTIAVAKANYVYAIDILGKKCIKELNHGALVNSLAILDDNSIVSGSYDGKVIIWQLQDGKYEKLSVLTHEKGVRSLIALADNSIVSGGFDGKLIVWRLQNDEYTIFSELIHGGWIYSIVLLTGNMIVSSGIDGKIVVWRFQGGKYEKLYELTHGSEVNSIAVLADGSIVSGGNDGKVVVWRLQNDKYEKLLELTHGDKVRSLAVLSDNSIVSGGDDGEIVIHDPKNANNQIRLRNTEDEEIYKIYRDGKWRVGRTKGVWRYGDDELMYKYGWFTNGSRCVPYYCFDEAEVMEYFLDARELPID